MLETEEKIDPRNDLAGDEAAARKIAQLGHYDAIVSELEDRGLLESQMQRVQSLADIDFLNEEDWKILTVLELFDRLTFEHCVETYLLAKSKIEKILNDNIILADIIKKSGVDLESFYRACLFHDIGKVEIPSFILNNSLTDNQWMDDLCDLIYKKNDEHLKEVLLSNTGISMEDISDEKNARKYFEEKGVRAVSFVPVKMGLGKEEIKMLADRGFSPENSLKNIIEIHEAIGERIVRDSGFGAVARLSGQHHNYMQKAIEKFQVRISSYGLYVKIDIADILRLADIHQALFQERSYKKSFPKLKILATLARYAREGFVGEYITHLWVSDEAKTLTKHNLDYAGSEKDLEVVSSFLKRYDIDINI